MTDSDPESTTNINRSGGADLNARGDITIGGDVVGRDKNIFTGEQQYDVHGLANPYLGLQSFTYADCAKYAGREKLIAETVTRLTAPGDPLALLFVTGGSGYSGKAGEVIRVQAEDDVQVTRGHVAIYDARERVIEEGDADSDRAGQ
jgi:hypothetical protein